MKTQVGERSTNERASLIGDAGLPFPDNNLSSARKYLFWHSFLAVPACGGYDRFVQGAFGTVILAVGLVSSPSNADSRDITLTWNASDATCPDATFVRAEIDRFLAGRPSQAPDRAVKTSGTVTRSQGVWEVALLIETGDTLDARTFKGDSCESVARATAFMTAISVYPERVVEESPSAPPSKPAAPPLAPTPYAPPRTQKPPANAATPTTDLYVRLFALGLADFATAPDVTFGAGLNFALGYGPLRVEIYAAGEPYQKTDLVADVSGSGARFRKLSAGGRACGAWRLSSVMLGPCVGGEGTNLRAESFGIANSNAGSTKYGEILGTAFAEWMPFPRMFLHLEGDVGIPLTRREFTVEPDGVVHTVGAVTGRAGLGVGVEF